MGRATSLDELWAVMGGLFPHADEDNANFTPRPTDVIISPYAKCGTTWLQQLVHTLRTGGDTDFEEVYEVVPWIDVATQLGLDLDADQRAEPRAFKSHRAADDLPTGCRYLVSFRDPKDAVVSLYRFLEGWLFEPGTITLEEFVAARLDDGDDPGSYWHHTRSWLARRDDPDVFLLTFEEMKEDLPGVAHRVAEFLGVPTDPERLAIATELSGFAYMSSNPGPFSDPWMAAWSVEHLDLPPGGDSSKVREGEVGSNRRQLDPATAARIDELWVATIGAATGLQTYDALVEDLRPAPAA